MLQQKQIIPLAQQHLTINPEVLPLDALGNSIKDHKQMHRHLIKSACVFAILFAVEGCTPAAQTPPGQASSSNQTGGIVVGSAGTVNQTIAPRIPSPYLDQLQKFYAEGAKFRATLWSPDMTDDQIDRADNEGGIWLEKTRSWIEQHITPAAAEKFMRWHVVMGMGDYPLNGTHKPEYAKKRTGIMILIDERLDNLDELMKSPEMYPQ